MSNEHVVSPTSQLAVGSDPTRLIAFYLPQFHPIPENDQWWGRGFTEWTNVTRARSLFRGHQQPHLPSDLGFYDLRLPEARQAQADLAREYGISGFCYYHYWFSGRRLLERPFNEVLASREPDFPFCLCWANECWTRTWDGGVHCVLMDQTYSAEDDLAHPVAVRGIPRPPVHPGRRPAAVPGLCGCGPPGLRADDIDLCEEALHQGLDGLFLCRVESHQDKRVDPRLVGFDAAVEFVPEVSLLGSRVGPTGLRQLDRVLRKSRIARKHRINRVYSYETLVRNALARPSCGYERFRCVTPSWDNSARRNCGAAITVGSSPELYREWLEGIVRQASANPPDRRVVFINAWNEWAEGNHIEPCQPGSRISGSDPGSPPGRLATDRSTRAGAAVVRKLLPWASRAEQEQSISGLMRIDSLLRGSVDATLVTPGRHGIFQLVQAQACPLCARIRNLLTVACGLFGAVWLVIWAVRKRIFQLLVGSRDDYQVSLAGGGGNALHLFHSERTPASSVCRIGGPQTRTWRHCLHRSTPRLSSKDH